MSDAVAVTPTLLMGPAQAAAGRDRVIPVHTAWDAVTVIKSGHQALLPPGAWDEAAAVLRIFGADEEWITFRLDLAGRRDRREGEPTSST